MIDSGRSSGTGTLPVLVPQEHGGALLSGGVPGHVGGPGRPPSELRARLRGSLDVRVRVLEEIADNYMSKDADRVRAVDVLAKYGLGAASDLGVDQVRERLQKTVAIIRGQLPAEVAKTILTEMREIWLL